MGKAIDRNSFMENLFNDYSDILKRECLRYINYQSQYVPLVEDCIQEAFVKAIINFDKIKVHPNIAGWLQRCCKNYLRSDIRKYRHRMKIINESLVTMEIQTGGNEMNAFERWLKRDDAHDMLAMIYECLSPKESIIFQDYFINDLSANETAKRNGLTEGSVHSGIRRIRAKIQKILHSIIFFSASQYILKLFTHYIDKGR